MHTERHTNKTYIIFHSVKTTIAKCCHHTCYYELTENLLRFIFTMLTLEKWYQFQQPISLHGFSPLLFVLVLSNAGSSGYKMDVSQRPELKCVTVYCQSISCVFLS